MHHFFCGGQRPCKKKIGQSRTSGQWNNNNQKKKLFINLHLVGRDHEIVSCRLTFATQRHASRSLFFWRRRKEKIKKKNKQKTRTKTKTSSQWEKKTGQKKKKKCTRTRNDDDKPKFGDSMRPTTLKQTHSTDIEPKEEEEHHHHHHPFCIQQSNNLHSLSLYLLFISLI